jgi:hypothetical protein
MQTLHPIRTSEYRANGKDENENRNKNFKKEKNSASVMMEFQLKKRLTQFLLALLYDIRVFTPGAADSTVPRRINDVACFT